MKKSNDTLTAVARIGELAAATLDTTEILSRVVAITAGIMKADVCSIYLLDQTDGSLVLAAVERSLNWRVFREGLVAACRVYCMIGLILAGAAFLTLAMGFMGLPRHLAEFIGGLNLSPFVLILMLTGFFIVLGCFLDGIVHEGWRRYIYKSRRCRCRPGREGGKRHPGG